MKCKAASVVMVILLAYMFYTPQPHYWTDTPLNLRLYLSFLRRIRFVPAIAQVTGLGSAVNVTRALREPLKLLLKDASDLGVRMVDDDFDGVPVRIYIPRGAREGGPGIFHIHGGAFILSDTEMYDHFCCMLAHSVDAVVVSVEYRRAPEHVFPAALEDSEKALRHFAKNAAKWNVSQSRISLFGDSAGGNIAAALAIRLRDSKERLPAPLKMQALVYPLVQAHNSSMLGIQLNSQDFMLIRSAVPVILYLFGNDLPPELTNAGYSNILDVSAAVLQNNHSLALPETLTQINQIVDPSLYDEIYTAADYAALAQLPEEKRITVSNVSMTFTEKERVLSKLFKPYLTNPDLAPLLATSLAGLPPAYIVVCEHDMLRDEGLVYAARLRRSNVPAHVQRYDKYHGFVLLEPDLPIADFARFAKANNAL